MQKKKENKKIKITLIVLGTLAALLLLGALIADKINTNKNLVALNEAIYNTAFVPSGSATGYTLSYPEADPEAPTRADRTLIYTLDEEKGYTFLEDTTDETGREVYGRMYGKPGEYYNHLGDHWEKKNTGEEARATPYSISRLTSSVAMQQISSIRKIQVEERTGYLIEFNHQWLVNSYTGAGKPIDSTVTYLIGESDGKPIVDSISQKLRSRVTEEEEKYIAIVEESIFFRAKETEDGASPDTYLETYFNEKIKDQWTPEVVQTDPAADPAAPLAETVGDSATK